MDKQQEVKRLYRLNFLNELESVVVLRETPKRYYTEPYHKIGKYVSKDDSRWFPERTIAIEWSRNVLLQRIEYAAEAVNHATVRVVANKLELAEFDRRYGVVDVGGK